MEKGTKNQNVNKQRKCKSERDRTIRKKNVEDINEHMDVEGKERNKK